MAKSHSKESNEAQYQSYFESLPLGVVIQDADGLIRIANAAAQKILGLILDQLLGRTPLHPGWRAIHEDGSDFLENEYPAVVSLRTAQPIRDVVMGVYNPQSEVYTWINITATPQFHQDSEMPFQVMTTIEDVTKWVAAEEKISESHAQLMKFASQVPGMLYQFKMRPDGSFCMPFTTDAIYEIFGCSPESVREDFSPIFQLIHPDDLPYVIEAILESARNLSQFRVEYRITPPGEPVRWVMAKSMPEKFPDGSIVWSGFNTDITGYKTFEETLQYTNSELEAIFNTQKDAIIVNDIHGVTSRANPAALELLGFNPLGRPAGEVMAKISRLQGAESTVTSMALKGATIDNVERNSEGRTFLVSAAPIKNQEASVVGAVTVLKDITERKQAEKEISRLLERLDLATRSGGIGIWDWDIVQDHLAWDDQMYALYGLKQGQFSGAYEAWLIGTHPEDRAANDEVSRDARLGKREYDTEFRVVWPDGSVHWLQANGEVIRDENGAPVRMVGINYDISERKRFEEQLKESEMRYRLIADNAADVIWVMDPLQGKFTYVSPSVEKLRGYTPEEVLAQPVNESLTPESLAMVSTSLTVNLPPFIARGSGTESFIHEVDQPHKDGSIVHTEVTTTYIINEQGKVEIIGVSRNINERKHAQEELTSSRNLLQAVIDNTPALVYSMDLDGRFLLANHKIQELFGYPGGEITGRSRNAFIPDNIAGQHRQNDLEIIQSGLAMTFQEENLESDGRHVYLTTKFPLLDAENEVYAVCGISTDMTAQKKLEEELRRSNDELEQFAYIASHDLQEPLRTVAGMVELLRQRYSGQIDRQADEYIHYAVDAAERMQKLINDLLDYSRVDRRGKPLEPTNMEAVLQNVLKSMQISITESRAVITYDPLPIVRADEGQMEQLLQNLIGNAIKFRSEKPPEIHLSAEKSEHGWLFCVRDNGIGIDPQYFERVFEIFQRLHTRRKYPGTGIGLALCKKIVERHDGKIWVESQQEQGAAFFFTLSERLS